MPRLQLSDNERIVKTLIQYKLLTFSTIADKSGIPKTTLFRRLKDLVNEGVVSFYSPASSYCLTQWMQTHDLGFRTSSAIDEECESDSPTLFTIGYESKSFEMFSGILLSQGVKRVVDVREIPNSRKSGFSSDILNSGLRAVDIEYLSLTGLGSSRKMRSELHVKNDFARFRNTYTDYLETRSEDLNSLVILALGKPTALMCYESEPSECHRSIIAGRLHDLGFRVVNL